MNIKELMDQRRSCRSFNGQLVSDQDMMTILECAMSAPSAHNMQPWNFIVVSNDEKIKELRKTTPYTNYEYPQAIVVCGTIDEAKEEIKNEYWVQSCSAAIQNILLAATSLGYGSLWMGLYPNLEGTKLTRKILGISENDIPIAIIGLGKTDKELRARSWYDESKVTYIK